MRFGEYLKQKRLEKNINLRKLAEIVDIAPAYLSDIENCKRNSPTEDKLTKILDTLTLNKEETNTFLDLAAKDHDNIAPDIYNYISNTESVKVALRKAQTLSLGDQEWLKIIEQMEDKEEDDNK